MISRAWDCEIIVVVVVVVVVERKKFPVPSTRYQEYFGVEMLRR